MKEMVTLSQTELKRMLVLQRVLEGQAGAFLLKIPGTPSDPVGDPVGRIRFCPQPPEKEMRPRAPKHPKKECEVSC
jgi:hypothetical protein